MLRKIIFSVTIILGLILASCGGSGSDTGTDTDSDTIDVGGLYSANCATCHGPDREGLSGLGSPLTPESLERLSISQVRSAIRDGVPTGGMLGFRPVLTAEEIDALIEFVKDVEP